MDAKHDVLIIGAGVVGVCIAHYLLNEGREVTLIDKRDIGAGASHGNAGYISPSHATPLANPSSLREGLRGLINPESPFYIKPRADKELLRWLLRFGWAARESQTLRNRLVLRDIGRLSAELYAELIPQGELDCNYEQAGLLEAYIDPQRLARAQHEAKELAELGLALKILDRDATLAMEPSLRDDIAGSVWMGADAHYHPARFMAEMGGWLKSRGVTVLSDTEVSGFEQQGRTISSVITNKGTLRANEYVLATGSWSPTLGQGLQLRIPVQPAKGYSVTMAAPAGAPKLPVLLMESRVATTPMGDLFRLAGTLEMAGLDLNINERRVQAIKNAIPRYFKPWQETEILETWAGLRPVTPDGLPIIGRPPTYDNLFLATGHAMLGMSLGAATGYLAAQYLQGQPPDLDLTPFRYSRF